MTPYLTIGQACQQLGVSRYILASLIRRGELAVTPSRIDRRVKLIARRDLDRLHEMATSQQAS